MIPVRERASGFLSWLRAVAGLALVSLVACGVLLWCVENAKLAPFLSRMAWLHVEEVKIASEWPLTSAAVRAWLPQLEGTNILFVKPNELITLLESKPWVESVTLKKEYPNRILIDVATKRAVALLVQKGQPWFLDTRGKTIEKAVPSLIRALDLPVVSMVDKETRWDLAEMLRVLERVSKALEPGHRLSEMSLGLFPVFRVFLAPSKIEVILSQENWETQLPRLVLLLNNPPAQIPPPQRINLLFSRKALVSSNLSN